MKSLDDIMRGRADSLDFSREDQLEAVQGVLNELYPGKARAKRLQDGILTITTPSATVANDLRFRQEELQTRLEQHNITRFKIAIQ